MMMRRPLLSLLLTSTLALGTQAAPDLGEDYDANLVEEYIAKYKQYAIAEMERMGIPASIKLAQAIHESQYGLSELALQANNHFGLKCGGNWRGNRYDKPSGEYVGDGVFSQNSACFRRYDNVADSYRDHSEHLASRANYAPLFKLASTDYEGWANGLLAAGYATDPEYGKRLVRVIRQYKLNEYDRPVSAEFAHPIAVPTSAPHISVQGNSIPVSQAQFQQELSKLNQRLDGFSHLLDRAFDYMRLLEERIVLLEGQLQTLKANQTEDRKTTQAELQAIKLELGMQSQLVENYKRQLDAVQTNQHLMLQLDPFRRHFNADGTVKKQVDIFDLRELNGADVFYMNGRRATRMLPEQKTITEVALKFGLNPEEVLKYNDLKAELSEYPSNFYVFLERKANVSVEENTNHRVQPGETMYLISQRYGVRYSRLLALNHLREGEEPRVGEFVSVHKATDERPKLQSQTAADSPTIFNGGSATNR